MSAIGRHREATLAARDHRSDKPEQEIPQANWTSFCRQFSAEHAGEYVDLKSNSVNGAWLEVRHLPLRDIRIQWHPDNDATAAIQIGRKPERQLTEFVRHTRHIRLRGEDLEIESSGGRTMVVHCYGSEN